MARTANKETLNKHKAIIKANFSRVLELVENGDTVRKALLRLGICVSMFYKTISAEDKVLLNMAKISNAKYGSGCKVSKLKTVI